MSEASPTSRATPPTRAGGADRRLVLGRRARRLALASVTYNVVEAVVAVGAGVAAGSVALVGFGLDSAIEVSSGLIVLWQFSHAVPEAREQRALRLMAICFLALAAFVGIESGRALLRSAEADPSPVGIALAAVSVVVMPVLSWAQRRTGRQLGSGAVVADGTQTLLCTYLSAVLLLGLLLNATLGWTWADPVAGLVIAAVALREGMQAWRGESCCDPTPEPPLARVSDAARRASPIGAAASRARSCRSISPARSSVHSALCSACSAHPAAPRVDKDKA